MGYSDEISTYFEALDELKEECLKLRKWEKTNNLLFKELKYGDVDNETRLELLRNLVQIKTNILKHKSRLTELETFYEKLEARMREEGKLPPED